MIYALFFPIKAGSHPPDSDTVAYTCKEMAGCQSCFSTKLLSYAFRHLFPCMRALGKPLTRVSGSMPFMPETIEHRVPTLCLYSQLVVISHQSESRGLQDLGGGEASRKEKCVCFLFLSLLYIRVPLCPLTPASNCFKVSLRFSL